MPKAAALRGVDMTNRVPVRPAGQPLTAQPIPQTATPPDQTAQSTAMISSMPGLVSSSDGIIRQYYGGRTLPRLRTIPL